ncbi:MAG: LD-carboxypeptidase [Armatimonadetes bacterium]|nr:LD-carboxypeptidase [Armatimonadota bacterium]
MLKPAALKPGDQVRVVTPGSPLDEGQIADGVALLESEGYSVTLAQRVFERDGYLAGPDEGRAEDLMAAFADPDVACVMCSRGGYGSARLLPFLDLDAMAGSGKMFCGFSDVTTLHLALNRRGLVTMHTPMLITLGVQREPDGRIVIGDVIVRIDDFPVIDSDDLLNALEHYNPGDVVSVKTVRKGEEKTFQVRLGEPE